MSNRIYNILFHTHTVSSIVISVALYVIFFAGSFSFFRDEIINWERNQSVDRVDEMSLDFDLVIDPIQSRYALYGRSVTISQPHAERRVNVRLSGTKDTLAVEEAKAARFFYVDTKTYEITDYESSYTLGEFLYRLHFFAQIPYPVGYYLSGFVAFFFLFAIITGVLIHWRKIISSFYVFRPWAKLKTIWTDAHTALGLIGLPFQLVYAVTGAFFMIKLLLLAPVVSLLYDGDKGQLYQELGYTHPSPTLSSQKLTPATDINWFVADANRIWPDFNTTRVHIDNYGDSNMQVRVEGEASTENKLLSHGHVTYLASTKAVLSKKDPLENVYLDTVKSALNSLHFADYAGLSLRLVSFVLGIITCFVILSGVMIWLTARDKKKYEGRKKFNTNVGAIYLGACLGLYPAVALFFCLVKIMPMGLEGRFTLMSNIFFVFWLAYIIYAYIIKDFGRINRHALTLAGCLGLLIPILNGIQTNQWFWRSLPSGHRDSFFVDVLWLVLSAIALVAAFKTKAKARQQESVPNGSKKTTADKTVVRKTLGERPVLVD